MNDDLEAAAQSVINNWESGDLAGAVNDLESALDRRESVLRTAAELILGLREHVPLDHELRRESLAWLRDLDGILGIEA